MKIRLLIAAASMAFVAASCNQSNKKEKSAADTTAKTAQPADAGSSATVSGNVISMDDWQINLPSGWKKEEKAMGKFNLVMLMAPREAGFSPNLNVLKDDLKGRDLRQYIADNLKQMAPMNISMQDSGAYKVSGIDGQFLRYSYEYQGRKLTIKSYVFPKNDVAYVITGSCLSEQVDAFIPQFDEVVNSFEVK